MDRKKEMGADQSISEVQMGNVGKKRSEEDGVVHKRTELMGGIQKHEKHGKKRKNNHEEGGLIQNEQGKKKTDLMLSIQRNEEKGKKIQTYHENSYLEGRDGMFNDGNKNPEEGGLIQKNDDQGKKRTELMLGIQKHEKQGKKRKSFHNTSSDRNVEGRDMMFHYGNKNNPDPMSNLRVVSSFDDTCNLADPSLHLSDHHHGQNEYWNVYDENYRHGEDRDGICTIYYMANDNWEMLATPSTLEYHIDRRDIQGIRKIMEALVGRGVAVPVTVWYTAMYPQYSVWDQSRKRAMGLSMLSGYNGEYRVLNFYAWPRNIYNWVRDDDPKWVTLQFGSQVKWLNVRNTSNLNQLYELAKKEFPNFPENGELLWYSGKGTPKQFNFIIEGDDKTMWNQFVACVMKLVVAPRIPLFA